MIVATMKIVVVMMKMIVVLMEMIVVMMKVIVVMMEMIVVMMVVTRSEVRLLCISQCLVTRSVPEPDLHIAPVHFPGHSSSTSVIPCRTKNNDFGR